MMISQYYIEDWQVT